MIDCEQLDIYIKANNELQLTEPTKYPSAEDGTIKKYMWINDSIHKYDILHLPKWLCDIIIQENKNHRIYIIFYDCQLALYETTENTTTYIILPFWFQKMCLN